MRLTETGNATQRETENVTQTRTGKETGNAGVEVGLVSERAAGKSRDYHDYGDQEGLLEVLSSSAL